MAKYAADTDVSAGRSKDEIESILQKYGADRFVSGWDESTRKAFVSFQVEGRRFRFVIDLPDRNDTEFWVTPGRGLKRTEEQAYAEYEKAIRQRWRALALIVKAKVVAVDEKIVSFADEFLAYTILPDNTTVGQWADHQLTLAYQEGKMPPLLPNGTLLLGG